MTSGRVQRLAVGVAVLVLTFAAIGAWTAQRSNYCACIELDPTVEAVAALSRENWQSLERASLAESWPEATLIPCEPFAESGLAALEAAIERCCNTCGTCGGPFVMESVSGLRSIGVMVCRDTSDQALGDLKRLVEVTLPETLDAVYEDGWSAPPQRQSLVNAYRWQSRGETFVLEVTVGARGDRWVGVYDLTRCQASDILEEWVLEEGSIIKVVQTEVHDRSERRELWFSYLSACHLRDTECLNAESRRLWPRVQALAERDNVSAVSLFAEDCRLGVASAGSAKRGADGEWEWDVAW